MKLAKEKESVYYPDMSKCMPSGNLSSKRSKSRWQVIPYSTSNAHAPIKDLYVMKPDVKSSRACFKGKAVASPSDGNAGDISFPLDRRGWHAVFVGLTGKGRVKIKFSGDTGFTTFKKAAPDQKGYEEAIVGFRKLDGEKLVFSPAPQDTAGRGIIVYIKLVPLTRQEVKEYNCRFSANERILTGTRDSAGWVNDTEQKMADAVFNQFIDSPVGTLYFGMPSFGCILNYEKLILQGKHFYVSGKSIVERTVKKFCDAGDSPLACAARLAHRAGMKIHFFQRPGRFFELENGISSPFYSENPQWRLKNKNGTDILGRMSVVYPEVRRYLVECMRETLKYEPDGINICMIRGAPLAFYEAPLIEEFRKQYDADPAKLKADDQRLINLRCKYTTQYIRDLREMLDKEGKRRKRKFQLSVMVFGDRKTNRHVGLDIEKWIELSLVDIINPWHIPVWWPPTIIGKTADFDYWASLQGNKTKIVPFVRYRWEVVSRLADKAYKKGFSEFALWDIDWEMDESRRWQTLRKIVSPEAVKKIKPDEWLPRVGYFESFDNFGRDFDFGPFGAG